MKKITGLIFELTKNGEPMVRAKVQLVGAGISLETVTSNKGAATFSNPNLAGKTVELLVNGVSIKKDIAIPAENESGIARAKIETAPATAAPHGDAHAAPHGDAHGAGHVEEEEGHIFIVRDSKRNPIHHAVVRVSHDEAYLTEDGETVVPFFDKDTIVEVSAPGFKSKKVTVEPDDDQVKVTLESVVRQTIRPDAYQLIRFGIATVVLLALVFLGFNAPKGAINLDMPSAIQTGIQIATWLVLTGSICATIFAIADRVYRKQFQDIKWALLALVLIQLGGWNVFIGPEGIGFWRYGFQAAFLVASMFALYVSAFSGTPDMTTPGAFWLINVAISMLTGTFGPISDWMQTDGKLYTLAWLFQGLDKGLDPKFTLLVIGMAVFAGVHFVLDISGWLVKGEDPAEKYGSLALTALLVAVYYLVTGLQWLSPVASLVVVSAGAALLSEAGKMGYGFIVPEADQAQTPAGKALLRTKWDGAALGVSVILIVALVFGYV